jgi:C4-dicarboxylate-binding protein DctP
MRWKVALAVLSVAIMMQTFGAQAACDEGETLVRFSHVVAESGHPKGEAAARLAERVNEALDGDLCMEVHPDASLFEDDAALEALIAGELELAAPSTARFDRYTERLRLFDLPFLFRDEAALRDFAEGDTGRELLASLESHGLVGLEYWLAGFKQFSADRALLLPEDARGLSFRTQDSELSAAMIESLGATARPMPLADVQDALRAGEINGQENTWSNIATQGFHKVQDGITETNHQAFLYVVVTSRSFLDRLSPEVRDRFLKIITETTLEANTEFAEYEARNRTRIAETGAEIRTLTEEQRAQWVEAMQPVWNRFADAIGRETIEGARDSGI